MFMMGVALTFEHLMHLEPCSMCIFQRVAVISAGTIALIGAIHHPAAIGIKVYGGLTVLASMIGAGLSIQHLWLQSLPEDEVPACGPGLDYLMDIFPLFDVIKMVLSGDGNCAEVVWSFMGISIPGWTLVGFIGLIALAGYQVLRKDHVAGG